MHVISKIYFLQKKNYNFESFLTTNCFIGMYLRVALKWGIIYDFNWHGSWSMSISNIGNLSIWAKLRQISVF